MALINGASEEYNQKVSDITLLYVAFRAELSPDQKDKLDSLLTAFDNLAHDEAVEALFRDSLDKHCMNSGKLAQPETEKKRHDKKSKAQNKLVAVTKEFCAY